MKTSTCCLSMLAFALLLSATWYSTASAQDNSENPRLTALIVDGQNNHKNWATTTRMVKHYLEESGRFYVDVMTSKPKGTDPDFKPTFGDYDVVISNFGYGAAPWPQETQAALVEYMNNGGGLVVYHAADNSFPEWKEFNEMIGLGGWGGRNESSGPYVYLNQQGEEIRDDSKGPGGNHGPQHEFSIVIRNADHPIMKDLPGEFLHIKDELYQRLRGPAVNMKVLGTSFSAKKFKGTERHEPMVMTIDYGKGRIFHTPMGHGNDSCECVGFITLMQRGTEWAATGKVTIELPKDFPTADKTSSRSFAAAMEAKAAGVAEFGAAIDNLITTVNTKNAREAFETMLPPVEFKKFVESFDPEDEFTRFKESDFARRLESLKSVDVADAKFFNTEEAEFEFSEGKNLRFQRVDGKWYLAK